MPRDGSGIYSQPFPVVVEGTTIESTVYNGYTADITIDLNTPRPISSGGTGANNAADAMAALGGEGSKIEVTNYDSHAFTAGSFYSKASASNPPVTGHAFAGICYVAVVSGVATSDMFIEVRDRDEATQPGSLFVRQKKNGTWSGWLKAVGTTTGATPPTAPTDGMLWWDPTQGKLFIWYSDPNTAQWVEAVATPDLGPDDFVSVDVAQNFTEAEKKTARSNIYAAPFDALAYNGMQINGSMEVSQEKGTGLTTTHDTHICDVWRLTNTSAGVVSASPFPSTTFIPGYTSVLTMTVTTAVAGGLTGSQTVDIETRIEGYRCARLAWGTASAQPITIGFWSAHSKTGKYSVIFNSTGGTRTCATSYTQNVSGTPEYKIITIPGDTTGSWNTANGTGLAIHFVFAAGPTGATATEGAWGAGYVSVTGQVNGVDSTANILRITGVVVLPGIEAPSAARSPLIMRPYPDELLTCQRYWARIVLNSRFYSGGASIMAHTISWPRSMRSLPTITPFAAGGSSNITSTSLLPVDTLTGSYNVTAGAAGDCFVSSQPFTIDARL